MKNTHELYTRFKEEFPELNSKYEELGRLIHEDCGPVGKKERWLIKIAISASSGHMRALETHIRKATDAGASQEEIKQTLLLLIPTVGFPTFMEAYSVYKQVFKN
jgi:alkylhydroperoxidase/carboxymuconolactone decarboxylase family protein YurZ